MASNSQTGSRCEFRTWHSVPKKDGNLIHSKVIDPFGQVDTGNDDCSYALVVRRTFTEKSELKSIALEVNSPHLLKAFREVVNSYPTVPSDFSKPFELTGPFQMLMHYWDELHQYRTATDDDYVRQHLSLLFDFMNHEIGLDRENIQMMVQKNQITYLNAWTLFRPGNLLYTTVMGQPWLLKCEKTAYEENTSVGPYMVVYCTYTDHDGTLEGRAAHEIWIIQKKKFASENPAFITDLPIYPRRFVSSKERGQDLENRLKERGRKFLALKGVCVQAYNGLAQYLKEPPYTYYHPSMAEFDGIWLPFTETGRVVLDRKTFQEDQYSNQVQIQPVTELEPLLCPPYALGYSLSRKEWCRFFVDNMREVEWKTNMWNALIVSDEQKLVLQALVTSHHFPDNARDQPEQKGRGLVVLLYGTPGSGKTLTAETSAEGTERPLISTSLGELNKVDNSWLFEYNLKRVLQYATTWKAVVLFDEADVFLEARNPGAGNSKRNALVAIFLKELEYFSGIVFLTTNRLASFDQAMLSRVHLALGYTPPSSEMRRNIWNQCLSLVPEDENGIQDVDEVVGSLVEERLNGREISNAVNTARTIARFSNERLQQVHIKTVLRVRHEFHKDVLGERRKATLQAAAVMGGISAPGGLSRQNSIVTAEPEEYAS